MRSCILFLTLFFTACSHSDSRLVHIPEASGICYAHNSNTLFVANDEGKVFEITAEGEILRKKRLGNYDLEGVACDSENGQLLFAVEESDNILIVNQKTLAVQKEINIKRKFKDITVLKKDKKNGLEGITIAPNAIYLSNQSNKKWPKSDPSVVIKIDSLNKKKVAIKKIIDHGYKDIAGLAYHEGYLYMVSDTENLLIKYDLKKNKTVSTRKLAKSAQEGITFDNKGYMYIADDEGSIIKERF
ncbi:MAG: SdiA-regulated domain-containing protein [Epsilonproteobacteria bacterium]|nr:SdiA-regulated domain-containing protein [Campylobacterota bacterium]